MENKVTINEFYKEYENLTDERREAGLQSLFDALIRDKYTYDELVQDILKSCANEEDYDYFGSEGMDI